MLQCEPVEPLAMNPEPTGTVNGYWMPTIVVDEGVSFERDAFLATLKHSNHEKVA